jgi:uncharacterized delta-60 repeat protein
MSFLKKLAGIALVLPALVGATSAFAAPELDETFGSGGRVTTNFFQSSYDQGVGLALAADGSAFVAGLSQQCGDFKGHFALSKYLENGQLDSSFNGTSSDHPCSAVVGGEELVGATDAFFPSSYFESVRGVARQSDGKILLVGSFGIVTANGAETHLAAVRFCADGRLDKAGACGTGFGPAKDGRFSLSYAYSEAKAVALQGDGKAVLVGHMNVNLAGLPNAGGGGEDMLVIRLSTDGTLDTSFGDSGITVVSTKEQGYLEDYANAVAVDAADQIYVAGKTSMPTGFGFGVARLSAQGQIDHCFGDSPACVTGGYVKVKVGDQTMDEAQAVVLDSTGKIFLSGTALLPEPEGGQDVALARLDQNGKLDPSFGIAGVKQIDFAGYDIFMDAARQEDGKYLLAGSIEAPGLKDFTILRLCSDGRLDDGLSCGAEGFGEEGVFRVAFPGYPVGEATAVGVDAEGRIVAAGLSASLDPSPNGNIDFALVRIVQNPPKTPESGDVPSTETPASENPSSDVPNSAPGEGDAKAVGSGPTDEFGFIKGGGCGCRMDAGAGNGGAQQALPATLMLVSLLTLRFIRSRSR